jgi:hypothetical protein
MHLILGAGKGFTRPNPRPLPVPESFAASATSKERTNGLVNGVLQSVHTLYTSTPEWSWWVAHGMFGATVGIVGATLLRRGRA